MVKALIIALLVSGSAQAQQVVRVSPCSPDTAVKINNALIAKGYVTPFFFKDSVGNWLFPVDSWMKQAAKYNVNIVTLPYSSLLGKRPVVYYVTN